jgi:hypothetical protein
MILMQRAVSTSLVVVLSEHPEEQQREGEAGGERGASGQEEEKEAAIELRKGSFSGLFLRCCTLHRAK